MFAHVRRFAVGLLALALPALLVDDSAAARLTPRIANGVLSQDYPAVGLLLFYTADGEPNGSCSGTMVGCETFVTAAHCVCENDGDTFAECLQDGLTLPSHMYVFLQHGGLLPVRSVAIHEEYNFGMGGDIAVLQLATPMNGIAPLPINRTAKPAVGTTATLVGFGSTGFGPSVGIKRTGRVSVAECSMDNPNDRNVCWTYREPLGEPGTNSDTCEGDSGGPLLFDFGAGDVVAGVTSGGSDSECHPPDDSFDTDVFFYRDFVVGIGGSDLDRARCGDLPQLGEAGAVVHQDSDTLTTPEQRFSVDVPAGTRVLRVGLNGDTGGSRRGNDFDLFIRHEATPTIDQYDCRGREDPSAEFCEVPSPQPGTWNVLVRNFREQGTFQLTSSVFAGCVGDCDADGAIAFDDLAHAVDVALGQSAPSTCGAADANADRATTVEDLVLGVNATGGSCAVTENP